MLKTDMPGNSFFKDICNLLPVCYGEDGLVLKPLSDGLLQQLVSLLIDAGCGFINTQELHKEKTESHVQCCDLTLSLFIRNRNYNKKF